MRGVPLPPQRAAEKEDGHKRTDAPASDQARKSHSRPNGRLKRKEGTKGQMLRHRTEPASLTPAPTGG